MKLKGKEMIEGKPPYKLNTKMIHISDEDILKRAVKDWHDLVERNVPVDLDSHVINWKIETKFKNENN